MKKKFFLISLIILFIILCSLQILPGIENVEKTKITTLYKNLDPKSVVQHFAFYKLYPDSVEGKKALKKAWCLLNQPNIQDPLILPTLNINLMIDLVNKQSSLPPDELDLEKLDFLESLGSSLKNRKLKGHKIWKVDEIIKLNIDEIDLARALFLEEMGDEADAIYKIRYFEACLDLMALQIIAKLNDSPTDIDKINAINDFIFYEKKFRFPPLSIHTKEIDTFTFLSTVMDTRRGVCLGVSILYLSLAQRLGLNLEIITPPGHIYIRYKDRQNKITNIETTARGVDTPSDLYLGIETKKLQQRNIKEVIGLAFINQASVYWGFKKYEDSAKHYEKALKYLSNDPLLKELLGLNLLFINEIEKGRKILMSLKSYKSEFLTTKDNFIEDYLENKTDIEALKAIFLPVDSSRSSIIEKQNILKNIVEKYPYFRAGLFQLANTYLQIGREKEALKYLKQYFNLDSNDIIVNYYLAVISFERLDYQNAWEYLKNTEKLLKKENHFPKTLRHFKEALKRASYPEL